MKRYLLILLTVITLSSCNPNDDNDSNYYFEYIPVTTVDVPEEFSHGQTYQLTVRYELPDNCTAYYHYDYIYRGTSRIIATIGMVSDSENCEPEVSEGEYIINVEIVQYEPYIFKFWQGVDDLGEDIFLIVEVPVI